MNNAWAQAQLLKLRQAAANAPGAELLRPYADRGARRGVTQATREGGSPSVRVQAHRHRLTVSASGRGAGTVLNSVREELHKSRHQIVEDLATEGRKRMRGQR